MSMAMVTIKTIPTVEDFEVITEAASGSSWISALRRGAESGG
jgi:hypothetical protein